MYGIEEDEGFVKYKSKWLLELENDYICKYAIHHNSPRTNKEEVKPTTKYIVPVVDVEKEIKPLSRSQQKINLVNWRDRQEADMDKRAKAALMRGELYDDIFKWYDKYRRDIDLDFQRRLKRIEVDDDGW